MKFFRVLGLVVFSIIGIFVIIPLLFPQVSLFLASIFSVFLPRLGQFYEYDDDVMKKQVISLQEKLNVAVSRQALYDVLKKENNHLRQLLKLPQNKQFNYINGEVITRNNLTWHQAFIIGVGYKQGVQEGCAVIANNFLVGQVVKVTASTAVVHTLLHPNIKISCEVRDIGGIGILSGELKTTEDSITYGRIKYLSRGIELPKKALFITSGLGNLIPRGIKVGRLVKDISYELTREAHISFFASFEKIYFVSVMVPK